MIQAPVLLAIGRVRIVVAHKHSEDSKPILNRLRLLVLLCDKFWIEKYQLSLAYYLATPVE